MRKLCAIHLKAGIVLAMTMLVTPVLGAGVDLHRLWDDRCAECHKHSGDFARRSLSVSSGELQGRHHVHDLRRFMRNHYLPDVEVDAVYNMLLAQASNQARFKDDCSECHGTAAEFVRDSLELRQGVLHNRESGYPVRGHFLDHHRELDPGDIEFFLELLTRVANEVYRP